MSSFRYPEPNETETIDSLERLIIPEGFIEDPLHPHFRKADGSIHICLLQEDGPQRAVCPFCGHESHHFAGYKTRTVQTLPIMGATTWFHIRSRRYRCDNPECQTSTFTVLSEGFRVFQHRSDQLNITVLAISTFCSDKAAEIICRESGIAISHDSIRRLLDKIHIEDDPDVKKIGVDDVCVYKGRTYLTAIYDAEDHHLLALLEGRDGEELKKWLQSHKKVRMVARDRASAYASAISAILPDCVQVADRFHLFQNLLGYLKDIFKEELPSRFYVENEIVTDKQPAKVFIPFDPTDTAEFKALDYDDTPPVDENGNPVEFVDKGASRNVVQYRKQEVSRKEKHEKVIRLRSEWEQRKTENRSENKKLKEELAEKYGIHPATVNKYLKMTSEEVENLLKITVYKKRETPCNNYLNMIYKMCRDGVAPILIYYYAIARGCKPGRSLTNHIRAIRINNGFGNWDGRLGEMKLSPTIQVITRSDVLKYMTCEDEKKKKTMETTAVAQYYEQIKGMYPVIEELETLWKAFHALIMGSEPDQVDVFCDDYQDSKIASFINGIKKDIAPVKNAISFQLNSGFVEGCNCRYKLTKRTMFGRAELEHLFRKTYMQSIIMRGRKESKELLEVWLTTDPRKQKKKMPI